MNIEDAISYNPVDGQFVSLVARGQLSPGDQIRSASVDKDGYKRIKFEGKTYKQHRLAVYLMTGRWPVGSVGHKNGDRADNRWSNICVHATSTSIVDLVSYDPDTGEFTAKVARLGVPKGAVIGYSDDKGYRCAKLGGEFYRLHRLAFFLMEGRWPVEQVDHINGDPSDNSWANLREATSQQNSMNRKVRRDNTSGQAGVYFNKQCGKWQARIDCEGRVIHLGTFDVVDDAIEARKAAEKEHFREWSRAG